MPNNDYIKRSDAIEALCGQCRFYDSSNDCGVRPCFVATRKDQIKAIPAADVEPVRHGRWIQSTEECGWSELECAECSECGEDYVLDEWGYEDFSKFMNYCPNCGAKLDKEENGDNKNL